MTIDRWSSRDIQANRSRVLALVRELESRVANRKSRVGIRPPELSWYRMRLTRCERCSASFRRHRRSRRRNRTKPERSDLLRLFGGQVP